MRLPQWARARAKAALRRRRTRHAHEVRARLLARYRVRPEFVDAVDLPLLWWPNAPNFGDAMSPWLVQKMTGATVVRADRALPHYAAIGSILRHVRPTSVVWGTGSFGEELDHHIAADADYRAVRGPLTRQKILNVGGRCPKVYGDPALLAPLYHQPEVRKTHEIGLVLRWSERKWKAAEVGPGVRVIDLGTDDVEGVLDAILSCRQIVTSSLHGLVIADAYGIPSAWLESSTPKGGEFKFHDYFASVHKIRASVPFNPAARPVTVELLRSKFTFDDRPLQFSYRPLLDACPFLERIPAAERAG
jgi:pyruvyltransferase